MVHVKGETMKKLHIWAGIIGLIGFALTGQYMAWALDRMAGMEDGPRMLYRSSHIYFLFASMINVILGLYLTPLTDKLSAVGQKASSVLLLLSPPAFLLSFFLESTNSPDLERILTGIGAYLILFGGGGHMASHMLQMHANRKTLR